jgi:putative DNA primase/helicase
MLDPGVLPNHGEAARFLAALDPADQRFTFQTFDDNKARGDKQLAQIRHGTLDRHWPELVRLNNGGAGVFVTINETDGRGRKASNIVRARSLFLDLDGAALDPVATCSAPPHIITESSPGRWHCYWIVSGLPLDAFTPMQKALAVRFGGDTGVHDLPRVLRLPGFVHRKGAPFLSLLQDVDEQRPPYTFEQMREAFPPAPAPPPPPISRRALAIRAMRPAVLGILRVVAQAPESNRNKVLYWGACRFAEMVAAGALSDSDAVALIVEAASRAGLPHAEAQRTAHSALRRGA